MAARITEPLLYVRRLWVRRAGLALAGGDGFALRGVDLAARAGERVAVVGRNGSGKSTLLRAIAGLIPVARGAVRVAGADVANGAVARRLVGSLFQDPDGLFVASRLDDDVAFGPENLGLHPSEIQTRVAAALRAVGLHGGGGRSPHALSGGERQRAALAGVLACRPACLCLDEPTAYLDAPAVAAWRGLVTERCAAGDAVVFTTLDMEEAADADRVVVLDAGRVAAQGVPVDILGDPTRLRSWGLDPAPPVQIAQFLGWEPSRRGPAPVRWDALRAAVRERWAAVAPPPAGSSPGGAPARRGRRPERVRDAAGGPGLEVSHARVTRGPRAGAPALAGFSLGLRAGCSVCLMGRGGAGKTTAALVAAGLLPLEAGAVTVDGQPVGAPHARRQVGMVFQRPEDQFFGTSVWEEVAFGPRQRRQDAAAVHAMVAKACMVAGVPPAWWRRSPFVLSGGEMRRVALAAVLACGPRYLVVDEPTAGLDATGCADVRAALRRVRASGHGVLLVTHRADDAASLADEVVILDGGRVRARDAPAAVLADPRLPGWGVRPPSGPTLRNGVVRPSAADGWMDALGEALTPAEVAKALRLAGVSFAPGAPG